MSRGHRGSCRPRLRRMEVPLAAGVVNRCCRLSPMRVSQCDQASQRRRLARPRIARNHIQAAPAVAQPSRELAQRAGTAHAQSPTTPCVPIHTTARNGSRVDVCWPCGQDSRPKAECHQRRKPAPRGDRRGVTGFDCGAGAVPAKACVIARWLRPDPLGRVQVLALILGADPPEDPKARSHDAQATRRSSAQTTRTQSRSHHSPGLVGDRCPTTPERPEGGRDTNRQSSPGRPERSPLRAPAAIVRRGSQVATLFV